MGVGVVSKIVILHFFFDSFCSTYKLIHFSAIENKQVNQVVCVFVLSLWWMDRFPA